MKRFLAMAALAAATLLQAACSNDTPADQQNLVDRATLAVQEMMTQTVSQDPQKLLRNAKGVMICPRIFKAGFFFGGEGGSCVLLARAGNGTWSYPAFYTIGSGSFGLQIGLEDSQLFMLIMTQHGLNAVLNSQVKLGANAGVAIATIGGGVQGATTTAAGADIVAFSASRGLYGGVALEGSVMTSQFAWDQSYYNQPVDARQIVMAMQGNNPGAEPLRDVLTRYGTPAPSVPVTPPQQQPGYAPAYPQYQPRGMQAPPPPPGGYMQQTPAGQQPGYLPPASTPAYPPAAPSYAPSGQQSYYPAQPAPAGADRGPIQQQQLAQPNG